MLSAPLTRLLIKPWWLWKCSSSWEHAQALRVIIGTNSDSSQFPRQCYDLFKQWIHSLLLGSSPVTRIIPSICILFPACTAIVPIPMRCPLSNCCPGSSSKWSCHGSHPFLMISKSHPLHCLQQGSPHHPFWYGYAIRSNSFTRSFVIPLGWYKEFQWSLYQK